MRRERMKLWDHVHPLKLTLILMRRWKLYYTHASRSITIQMPGSGDESLEVRFYHYHLSRTNLFCSRYRVHFPSLPAAHFRVSVLAKYIITGLAWIGKIIIFE